ncbi:Biofilm growth-associated repressor [Halomonas sp. THAF12]|uniref:ArsR/SmtB family transcription factor n=1 Tax=Halomonas sp. THAF12 TaxID=2587849 RepID=UPI00126903C7|nr:metalloregulator ArsR/SmtB family transcription factor [Halomonas sp. THAF12]QFT85132.1 Biofilm growth-associated repressor [Halomonas sp. THAF12]
MSTSQAQADGLLHDGDDVIDRASALLKAMANDNRLRILCLLDGQELSVTELNHQLALSQSALSQHLAILRRENLVSTRRASQTIYYSLNGDRARILLSALAGMELGNH